MNNIWSKHVQGVGTLYSSRRLRFNDMFFEQYRALFGIDESKALKILEIGCGPGALAGALHRWYKNAEITAIDRDSGFIEFAKEHEPGITFLEGDATELPFEDNSFDITISYTVSEHVEPTKFFSEQRRVLKPNGTCIVLSARRGINIASPCIDFRDDFEENFWNRVQKHDNRFDTYEIGKYHMTEAELPAALEQYGFHDVKTGYAVINLTPDDPSHSSQMAHDMINSMRQNDLDSVNSVFETMPEHFSGSEAEEMKKLINKKYDTRIKLYDTGEKQWDTNVSITMAALGKA